MHPIHDELLQAWSRYFKDASIEYSDIHGLRNYRPKASLLAAEAEIDALQPWFAVQEVTVDLLFNIYLSLNNNVPGPPVEHRRLAPWALVGAASGFGASLLLSCAAGYDTPAKAQLRTYTEALLLLAATQYDSKLADDYLSATTDAKVLDFWHKKAGPTKLHKRIIAIEKQFGFSDAEIASFTELRRREYETLSQSSHLSFLGATMTCLSPSITDPDILRLRLLGGPTMSSLRTLGYAAFTTWHVLRLVKAKFLPISKSDEPLLIISPQDPISQRIMAGWFALEQTIPKYLSTIDADDSDA
ncbi:MAG: hypothetical protein DU481_01235 [Nitrosomonas sp.]|uniref:hypothetical protein n=1 Tax=Nitrosomonas sp. TaxID=42353 RepID=UPI0032EAE819